VFDEEGAAIVLARRSRKSASPAAADQSAK